MFSEALFLIVVQSGDCVKESFNSDFQNLDLTLSQTTNFRLFQAGRVCRRQFHILMKMAEMFSKQIENTVGKGEIARYEQFLLFPQFFSKDCRHVKTRACLGKG